MIEEGKKTRYTDDAKATMQQSTNYQFANVQNNARNPDSNG